MGEASDWQRIVKGLRDGDRQVVHDFCEQYGDALQRVADRHLPGALRRRLGPEDVVQSACRTFLRRARIGEYQLPDSDSLWRLLCAITLTKAREQARFHLREKRGLNREEDLPVMSAEQSQPGFVPAARGPTPAEAAEFADQFGQLLGSLDEEEQKVVDLKLQEYTNEEVAEKLGCSERSVRRILNRVKTRLAATFQAPS